MRRSVWGLQVGGLLGGRSQGSSAPHPTPGAPGAQGWAVVDPEPGVAGWVDGGALLPLARPLAGAGRRLWAPGQLARSSVRRAGAGAQEGGVFHEALSCYLLPACSDPTADRPSLSPLWPPLPLHSPQTVTSLFLQPRSLCSFQEGGV